MPSRSKMRRTVPPGCQPETSCTPEIEPEEQPRAIIACASPAQPGVRKATRHDVVLEDLDLEAGLGQERRGRQAAHSSTDDSDVTCLPGGVVGRGSSGKNPVLANYCADRRPR